MNIQQKIVLKITASVKRSGIDFVFNCTTLDPASADKVTALTSTVDQISQAP